MQFLMLPPTVVLTRAPGDRRWAKQRGPVIILPHDPPNYIIAHEAAHVTQWCFLTACAALALAVLAYVVPGVPWAVLGLAPGAMGALMYLWPGFRFALEAQAYGAAARYAPQRLDQYTTALFSGYDTGRTRAACRDAIKRWV